MHFVSECKKFQVEIERERRNGSRSEKRMMLVPLKLEDTDDDIKINGHEQDVHLSLI